MSLRRNFVATVALCAMAACTDLGDDGPPAATSTTSDELDAIGLAQTPASLLVLGATADDGARRRLEVTLDRIGGGVIETMPPRLVIAQVPAGADPILTDLGVVARFDRAVAAGDVAGATLPEQRFLDVYSNRWWPQQVPPATRLAPRRAIPQSDAPFEAPARLAPTRAAKLAGGLIAAAADDGSDQIAVPYASGTVVISIVLPESNGLGEPSTEDWTEQSIRDTYLKVQAAIDNLAQAEPNSHLRFVVHLESAPDHGGLPGTVDVDSEFGKHAQWNNWADESTATAALLARILGHAVDPNDVFTAALEYDASLKARYHADAAYFVIVAGNGNYTAGIRAHAYIYGPWTVLDSSYGWETFNHEFGHIFGALDEYCPDACVSTTALQGYLGIFNANATFQLGGDGINNGQGEDQPSLMNYNVPSAINGYTRASWGWLDADGDGVIDVLDTFPRSTVAIAPTGKTIRATGSIVDQPPARMGGIRYSMNRIDALEYRVGDSPTAPWFKVALPADARGAQAVDVPLGELAAGIRPVWIRAINSVGNVEAAQRRVVTISGTGDTAPRVRLDLDRTVASTTATVTLHATGDDDDGDTLSYRFDKDGDGSYDTAWGAATDLALKPARAGVVHVGVQVKDGKGKLATATAELYAFAADAPPAIAIAAQPSVVHGSRAYPLAMTATAADPEGGSLAYRWLVDDATSNFNRHTATDWSSSPAFTTTLETPTALASVPLDLSAGDASLQQGDVRHVIALDGNTLAVAGGWKGVWFVDVSNRAAPVVLAHLDLETSATRLVRDGNRLWVLGSLLTVVDIHDLKAPHEVPQLLTARATRTLSDGNPQDLGENQQVWSWMYDQFGAKITDTRVEVAIDHPHPADLLITLYPPKQFGVAPIVLWDHKNAAGGARTLVFTGGNTPALKGLNGLFASETWQVQVIDDVANGQTGRLVSSKIVFQTASKAVAVLPDASRVMTLPGVFGGGWLAVAGDGVQILDASFAQLVTPVASIKGTPAQDAFAVGGRIVWMGPLQTRPKDGSPPTTPPLHGLSVIDVSLPIVPRLTRAAVDVGGDPQELARVGTRVYVRVQPTSDGCTGKGCGDGPPFTVVGSASALAGGSSSWKLGSSALRVDPTAFGDDKALWTINDQGHVAQYDVTSASALAMIAEYPRSIGSTLVPLAGVEVVLWQWGPQALIVHLDQVVSTVSRVYRVTVEARDPAGNVARAARTIHVIPYDHAPALTSVVATAGATTNDTWTFHVVGGDPDSAMTWDNQTLVRADWDGDGAWDSEWYPLSNGKGGTPAGTLDLYNQFALAGHYDVVFQVRDGFWAQSTYTLGVDVK